MDTYDYPEDLEGELKQHASAGGLEDLRYQYLAAVQYLLGLKVSEAFLRANDGESIRKVGWDLSDEPSFDEFVAMLPHLTDPVARMIMFTLWNIDLDQMERLVTQEKEAREASSTDE